MERITELIIKNLNEELTKAESDELQAWVRQSDANPLAVSEFLDAGQVKEIIGDALSKETVWNKLEESITEKKVVPLGRLRIIRWVAAASIAALFVMGYLLVVDRKPKEIEIVYVPALPADIKAPNVNRAMITLTDGRRIYLDSAGNGSLARQDVVKIVKLADGQILYSTESPGGSREEMLNTLTNPRGSKVIDITLSDGSKVWLNAGSSISYPVLFLGSERKVSITGEAYFEIAHNAAKPFIVSKGETSVRVLGTHFNVNAYEDETDIKVTLLEGSVKVSKGAVVGLLKPGQQAQVIQSLDQPVRIINGVDLESVMAWKNGQFILKETDIIALMRQIARWYDVDVVYEGKTKLANRTFGGSISRNVNLSTLLLALKENGVKSKLEKRKVIVYN